MYIGLISDTHGFFDPRVRAFLEPVDQIWHAGDWGGDMSFVRQITDFKPTIGVYGNCDGQDIRLEFPEVQQFECEGMKVMMTHIGGYPGHYDTRAAQRIFSYRPQLFVCGHSHILKVMYDKGRDMMTFNPGACGDFGWHVVKTALRFRIEDGKISDCEVFKLPREGKRLY